MLFLTLFSLLVSCFLTPALSSNQPLNLRDFLSFWLISPGKASFSLVQSTWRISFSFLMERQCPAFCMIQFSSIKGEVTEKTWTEKVHDYFHFPTCPYDLHRYIKLLFDYDMIWFWIIWSKHIRLMKSQGLYSARSRAIISSKTAWLYTLFL